MWRPFVDCWPLAQSLCLLPWQRCAEHMGMPKCLFNVLISLWCLVIHFQVMSSEKVRVQKVQRSFAAYPRMSGNS